MKLPKLYRKVRLGFYSFRWGVGGSGGVVFDVDAYVAYDCMRVLVEGGWKWQIVGIAKLLKDPDTYYLPKVDQETLNAVGMEMDGVDILIKIPQNQCSEEKFLN